ncbi:unnamed protein product [Merluccius merluccius]
MFKFPLLCVRPACGKRKLTAAGLYQTVRQVLDIDRWYDLATEYLECKGRSKKYPGWSEDILGQLDMGHRNQFPALLAYRYSCDIRVLRMTQLYKKLQEQHSVTMEAHPLYGILMARLSTCIFEWDPEDVAALRRAKEGELTARRIGHISEEVVTTRISQRELARHCRRRTRGVEETTRLIGSLISLFDSASGKDILGVPLLDHVQIQHIWQEQEKNVACIQDPEVFQLYTKTGTLNKGGVELCCYRCAHGSTSLVLPLPLKQIYSSASDAHFQAYLLEGLMHWNDDRMEDAVKGSPSVRSYGSTLREAVDQLSRKVLGTCWDKRYRTPGTYTGKK